MGNPVLDVFFQKDFEARVKHIFQEVSQDLVNKVRFRNVQNATEAVFNRMGTIGIAKRLAASSPVPIKDIEKSTVSVKLNTYVTATTIDQFELAQTSVDMEREATLAVTNALKLGLDQLILNEMHAHVQKVEFPTSQLVDYSLGTGVTQKDLDLDILQKTKLILRTNGVPHQDCTFIMSPSGKDNLLRDNLVISSDFNTQKVLNNGDINSYYGFNFLELADQYDPDHPGVKVYGLPTDPVIATDRSSFAFHKEAIGFGLNKDISLQINYLPERLTWLLTGSFMAGAVVIDQKGLIHIKTAE